MGKIALRALVVLRFPLVGMFLLIVLAGVAQAGTTVIRAESEGVGTITKTTGATNSHGAMVWNGSEWIVNNTWMHKFFTDTRTGQRLRPYNTTVFQGSQPGTVATPYNYMSVERSLYSYQKMGTSGLWEFNSVAYRVENLNTGLDIVLRSRGTGAGTTNPYFDIYIEDEGGTTITALRGDPDWFTYPQMSLDEAVLQTSPTDYLTGYFPSVNAGLDTNLKTNAYFLDIPNGADLGPQGVGKSYQFHTAALALADTALSLGSTFAVDFSYKWMDSSGNLEELQFLPYAEGNFTPSAVPEPGTLLLVGSGLAGLAVFRKRFKG